MNSGLFAGPARPTTPTNIIPSPLGQVAGCGPLVAQVFEVSPFTIGGSPVAPNFQAAAFGDWSPPRGVSRAWVSAVASGGFSSGDAGTGGTSSGLGGGGGSCVRLPIPCIPGVVVRYYVGPTNSNFAQFAALMYYRINPDGSLGFGPSFGSPNPVNALQVRCEPGSFGQASSGTVATGGNGGACTVYLNNTSIATAIAAAGASLPSTNAVNINGNLLRQFFPYQDFLPYSALYSGAGGAAYGATGPVSLGPGGLSTNTNMPSHVSFRANQYLNNPNATIAPAPSALSFLASNARMGSDVALPVPGTWGNGAPYSTAGFGTASGITANPGSGAVIFEWEEY